MELKLTEVTKLECYKVLTGLVIPRPIAWISTRSENGVANCAPFSFFNAVCEDPPLCFASMNARTDGAMKHTLKNILRTGEFVVNLVDEATANAMHISSYELPEEESEFGKTGLNEAACSIVGHPRIAEAVASFECRLWKKLELGPDRVMVFGEILIVHAREGVIDPENKRIDEACFKPIGRLYANRYCTTRERFELPGELPTARSAA